MVVSSLRLENFRNYETQKLSFSGGINVICGENAQGKTNLLEAVSFLSGVRSFRAGREKEMIRFGSESFLLKAGVLTQDREYQISVSVFENARRRLLVNGVSKRSMSELTGLLKTVLFLPDDLNLIKDGAAERRRFIDNCLCQLRPAYAKALSEYTRSCEHKLRLLKEEALQGASNELLDVFNQKMAQSGAVLISCRDKYLKMLAKTALEIHTDISGGRDALELRYRTMTGLDPAALSTREIAQKIYDGLDAHRQKETQARALLVGPHKDDLEVIINGSPARYYGSQGQTRTACLSLKLAERDLIFNDSGEYPVLLLDDVLSELDAARRDFVLNRIKGGQVLITSCEENLLQKKGKTFIVEKGRIVRQSESGPL